MRLIIFDLDGTLLNTLEDLAGSVNYALHTFGYQEHLTADYRYMVGDGITKLIERALPENARTEDMITRVKAGFVSHYWSHKTDRTRPYPGIPELLEKLKHAGMVLAVASNKFQEGTRDLIRYYFGDAMFQVVLGQREGIPTKPDPSIVEEILSVTGVKKKDTLYVGDSCIDMQTAVNAGVIPVGVAWGFRSSEELIGNGALHLVHTPEEILKIAGIG